MLRIPWQKYWSSRATKKTSTITTVESRVAGEILTLFRDAVPFREQTNTEDHSKIGPNISSENR